MTKTIKNNGNVWRIRTQPREVYLNNGEQREYEDDVADWILASNSDAIEVI
jgi:hypothetical protein